jgi:hypothetical protein
MAQTTLLNDTNRHLNVIIEFMMISTIMLFGSSILATGICIIIGYDTLIFYIMLCTHIGSLMIWICCMSIYLYIHNFDFKQYLLKIYFAIMQICKNVIFRVILVLIILPKFGIHFYKIYYCTQHDCISDMFMYVVGISIELLIVIGCSFTIYVYQLIHEFNRDSIITNID